jgi:peptidoglycan/LPS O-acetylase OafA/YrhL
MAREKIMYFQSLEGLRFAASALIVLYHYSYYFEKKFIIKGFLAVDLFFALSGFVITHGYAARVATFKEYGVFIRKRLARLYPLHVLTLGLYIVLAASVSFGALRVVGPAKYKFSELLYNATLTHAWGFASGYSFNTVSWSISAELAAYLLFPAILSVLRRGFVVGSIALIVLYIACFYVSSHLLGRALPELSWDCGVIRALPSFAMGSWLCINLERVSSVLPRWSVIAGFYISAAVWAAVVMLSLNDYIGLLSASLLVSFAAVADHRGLTRNVSNEWLNKRGELTYSIYMIHPLVATVLISGVGAKLGGESTPAICGTVCVATGVTYALARLSYEYFEKPARRWCMGASGSEQPYYAEPILLRVHTEGSTRVE